MREYYLKKKTEDKRDCSHHKVFGSMPLTDLPTGDFFVADPLEIKNQDVNYLSDFCASYAGAEVAEDHEGVALVPEYTFAKAKQVLAGSENDPDKIMAIINDFGLELRDICKGGCKRGFLERQYDPFHCDTENRPDRNFLADWRNWPADLDMLAWEHAQNSFFSVDGPYDHFDNLRNAMWQNKNKTCSILTGIGWRASWKEAPNAIIDASVYDPKERASGHALKIFGQMVIKNKFGEEVLYLVAQLSDGVENGDKGLYYFAREVINAEDDYGAFMFNDMTVEQARYHSDLNIGIGDSLGLKIWKTFIYWISNLIKKP